MAVNKPNITKKILSRNYGAGRNNQEVVNIAFHHAVTTADTLYHIFNGTRPASSHFYVTPSKIEQYVELKDTAWTNGNALSNTKSVTIEHYGTWLNGYNNNQVIEKSAQLVAWLRSQYPNARAIRHRSISATQCPGDLPVERIWARATEILNQNSTPAVPNIKSYTKLPAPVKYELKRDAKLWDFDESSHNDMRVVKSFPKGTELTMVGYAEHKSGSKYYMTSYSYNSHPKKTNGMNSADIKKVTGTTPTPPPTPTPIDVSTQEEQDTAIQVNTDTNTQQDAEIEQLKQKVSWLKSQVTRLIAWARGFNPFS